MLSLRQFRVLPSLRRFIHVHHVKCGAKLPSVWDILTGVSRWEAVQYAKGNTDPFFMLPIKRTGTKDCPTVVPSFAPQRIIGCFCNEDSISIKWWWLHEGFPRRCDCNYWFVLEKLEIPKVYEDSC